MRVAVTGGVALFGGHRVTSDDPRFVDTPVGRVAVLTGDACIEPDDLARVERRSAEAEAWWFDPESELQAEGLLEFAIARSLSSTPLIVIAGDSAPGEHAGGAIVLLGEVTMDPLGTADVVEVEVGVPLPHPEPHERPPAELPPILAQRLAAHHGTKIKPDYPADID